MKVLVTGATGYIGGRLVPRLLERGHRVRVLVRDPARVAARPWADAVEIHRGDLQDASSLQGALDGVEVAWYLVHAMCGGDDWKERDDRSARAFAAEGRRSGLERLVYLGGLQPPSEGDGKPSEHLLSRARVGRILREAVPTVEVRAGPVIGSGSASFEMVRYLTERLPAMVAPRWIVNPVQPIAVRDVLTYLVEAADRPGAEGIVEVGAEPLSFREMMLSYARLRGLRRVVIPVPVLAPALAARWVGLVTPIPNCLAVPLVEGVVRPVLADRTRARAIFPEVDPLPYDEAVRLALDQTDQGRVVTRWSGALGGGSGYTFEDSEGVVREVRTRHVEAPPTDVYRAFASLGGRRGWRVWRWAWEVRGLMDQLVGGPGLRRGRRHPVDLEPGEAVDFWRVEAARPPELLRLRAEMKLPGRAWLQWEAVPEGDGTRLVQTAFFAPVGLAGTLYWYVLYPIHRLIFSALVDAVARDARDGLPRRPGPGPAPAPDP